MVERDALLRLEIALRHRSSIAEGQFDQLFEEAVFPLISEERSVVNTSCAFLHTEEFGQWCASGGAGRRSWLRCG